MEDVYSKLFWKMFEKGFPLVYKGYKMNYYFEEKQAEIDFSPTDKKIIKMWELLK